MEKDIIKDAINEMIFGITDEEYAEIEEVEKEGEEDDKSNKGE